MTTRTEKIANLTDDQALSIISSLAGEFAPDTAPEGQEDQIQALQTLFDQRGQSVDVLASTKTDSTHAALGARQLLLLISEVETPELQSSLDEWLDNPPESEQFAFPIILAAPVVVAGCIAFLYVVGHTRFERKPDNTYTIVYDPKDETPMDKNINAFLQAMVKIMSNMIPK